MRKVCLLRSKLSHPGGVEKYTRRLAEAFVKRGDCVTILTTGKTEAFSSAPYKTISLGEPAPLSVQNLKNFEAWVTTHLSKHSYDLVFGLDRNSFQTHYRAGLGVHAAFLKRRAQEEGFLKKVSFLLNPLHRTTLNLEKQCFEHPKLKTLITNSHMVKKELLSYYRTPPEKLHVVHNGVEWENFQTPFEESFEKKEKLKKLFSFNLEHYTFLFIGNDYKRKGLHYALQALSHLKEPFHFLVLGKDKNQKKFEQLAYKLGIRESVHFLGLQKPALPYYQLSDALLIPSLYDPFANVTVEALALGLYVISSKYNGGHEILNEQLGETIEDLHNPLSFVQSLKKALQHKKTREHGYRIRQQVAHLSFSNQLNKIIDLTF